MITNRRLGIVAVSTLAILLALGVWFCFPSLRLLTHASQLQHIPPSRAEWVDAHRYDSEWFDAARVGRIDILRALYQAHYPINSQTSNGYTAVILAAYDDQGDTLHYLLDIGANACLSDRNGNTALMGAIYKGETDMARVLLGTTCPIDQTNNAGETALSFATLFGRLDLLPTLIAKGARIDHRDAQGQTPLAIAIKQGNTEAVAALQKLGASR